MVVEARNYVDDLPGLIDSEICPPATALLAFIQITIITADGLHPGAVPRLYVPDMVADIATIFSLDLHLLAG